MKCVAIIPARELSDANIGMEMSEIVHIQMMSPQKCALYAVDFPIVCMEPQNSKDDKNLPSNGYLLADQKSF
jgi:hypothetical protein